MIKNSNCKLMLYTETRTCPQVEFIFFFSLALRVSGRFLTFSTIKASERAGVLGPTTRTKDFEKV